MNFPIISDESGRFETPILIHHLLYHAAPEPLFNWTLLLLLLLLLLTALAAAAAVGIHLPLFRRQKTLIHLPSFYSSCSDDDDTTTSTSSSDADDDEMEETDQMDSDPNRSEDLNRAKPNETANFSFSLADLVGGMGVVKAWDGFGLGFNGGDFSFIDTTRGEILRSYNGSAGEAAVAQLASRAEIVSAAEEAGGAVVRVWDAREGKGAPAGSARANLKRRVAGVVAREGKVLVGDEGGEVAAVDLRNMAVVDGGESLGSWWRSAARCFALLSPRMEDGELRL